MCVKCGHVGETRFITDGEVIVLEEYAEDSGESKDGACDSLRHTDDLSHC